GEDAWSQGPLDQEPGGRGARPRRRPRGDLGSHRAGQRPHVDPLLGPVRQRRLARVGGRRGGRGRGRLGRPPRTPCRRRCAGRRGSRTTDAGGGPRSGNGRRAARRSRRQQDPGGAAGTEPGGQGEEGRRRGV
ncbi:MAG: hypothetical protein AVDCRST_MAG20-942, partial [uncultured Acidimicrobiales bacterium]